MLTYEPSSPDIENQVLVCCAGGGMAAVELHAGILKAIEHRYGRCVTNMAGGSAGGLVSSLHMSWKQDSSKLIDLIKNTSIDDWFTPHYWQFIKSIFNRSNYLMDNTKLFEFLNKELTLDAYDRVQVSLTQMIDGKIGKSFSHPGSPAGTTGTMSIQNIFPPMELEPGLLVGDGGVKNLILIPRVIDLPKYKHIFVSLVPESEMTSYDFKWKFLGRIISLLNGALEREMSKIASLHLEDLPNITVFRPECYEDTAGLLNWSDKNKQIDAGYEHANKIMDENEKKRKVFIP